MTAIVPKKRINSIDALRGFALIGIMLLHCMERFDLTELIRGVINSSAILLNQNEITLDFTQQEPLYAWADEFKVEEVVTNYLSNAIHHAEGEKRIDISCVQKGDKVRVSVFNTGNPIPEEDVDNIWIKFYKVDKARTREYGGSGIGLSIVRALSYLLITLTRQFVPLFHFLHP